ncbi:hypothetical protein BMW23_0428 [Bodo saltans virus]|uniref:Uncharacterized protein n=1 Tax=Bodo saltans virus TaxID=2024608 RepID=A0A2H4UU72_9VIRU|nr:hypothetical protein QJ851_gp0417 [Bodo saltans virus]ATZ80480.1 hypothetical protein BMW23_0428 [Bodo saltans virus]
MSEQNQTTQMQNQAVQSQQQMSQVRVANVDLPNDISVVTTAAKNLYIALNKANRGGVYELNESHQVFNDLNLISNIVLQLIAPQLQQQSTSSTSTVPTAPAAAPTAPAAPTVSAVPTVPTVPTVPAAPTASITPTQTTVVS